MTYYIFAGNSSNIRQWKKQAMFKTNNIKDALKTFDRLTKDITFVGNYNCAYLICSIGMPIVSKRNNNVLMVSIKDKMIPFIILQEYIFKDKPIVRDIDNSISIITNGFREEFSNNKYAVERFDQYFTQLKTAQMLLRFQNNDNPDNVIIGDTRLMMKNRVAAELDKNYLFDITEPDWDSTPINDLERISVANLNG